MVSVKQIIVAMADGSATVGAKLCCWFAATFLMRLEFISASETANIADLDFLACLETGVERKAWTGSRLRTG